MFSNELVLTNSTRNTDQLLQRQDYKIIKTISFHNQYSTSQFQTAYQQIYQNQQTLNTIKKLDKLIQFYWQAITSPQNDNEQVINKWKKIQNQKIFSRPYLQIGQCYQILKKEDKAIEYYQKCLHLFNSNDMGYYLIGKNLIKRKKADEGIDQLRIGLGINPQNKLILQTLASFYEQHRNWAKAIKYLELIQQMGANQNIQTKIKEIKQIRSKEQLQKRKKKQIVVSQHKPSIKIEKNIQNPVVEKKIQIIQNKPKEQKIDKPQKKIQINQIVPLAVKKSSKQDAIQKTIEFKTLIQRIKQNSQKPQNYWQIINLCKVNNVFQKALQFICQLIKNSRRQYRQTIRICKQLQEMYFLFQQKSKVFDVFTVLQKNNKWNIFTFLYHTYLSILNEDRSEAAKSIDASKITLFVDQQIQKNQQKHLLQNYILLFSKLINKENLDLLSLEEYFKRMIGLFQDCLSKKRLNSSQVIKEQIFLKNLTVQCSNETPTALLYLYNQVTQIKSLGNLLLKQELIFIVTSPQQFQKRIKLCTNIVVFHTSLKKLAKQIDNFKKRYEIYVVKTKEGEIYKEQIQDTCAKMREWNGRIRYYTQLTYNQIWVNLIQKQI